MMSDKDDGTALEQISRNAVVEDMFGGVRVDGAKTIVQKNGFGWRVDGTSKRYSI
jgi:hypothetical protein